MATTPDCQNTKCNNDFPWKILSQNRTLCRVDCSICKLKDQHILLAGGRDHSRSVVELDVKTGFFTELLNLPQSYHKCSVAIVRDYMYIVSCFENRPMYRMNLALDNSSMTQKWEEVMGTGTIPQYRTLVGNGDRLYSFGHRGNAMYNPDTNHWSKLPNMNKITFVFGVATLDHQIIVIGGITNDYYFDRSNLTGEIWDIVSSTWIPLPRFSLDLLNVDAAVYWNKWIFLIGKETGKSFFSFFIYNVKSTGLTKCPVTRKFSGDHVQISIVKDSLVILGDLDDSKAITVECIPVEYLLPSWRMAKHLILLRRLVEKDRAIPIVCEEEKVIMDVVKKLMSIEEDIFITIISFLIP